MRGRPILGFEGHYEVTEEGSVWSLKRGTRRKLKVIQHKTHGYSVVNLVVGRRRKQKRVHVLIATAFLPNPDRKPTVNHRDGVKSNNGVSNLEWATQAEQGKHASKTGLVATGAANASTKLFEHQLPEILRQLSQGSLIQDLAKSIGVNRNTITKALNRRYGRAWGPTLSQKRSIAAQSRWNRSVV